MTARRIATVAVLVDDYDRAKAHYCDALGFQCLADQPLGDSKRWLVVAPSPDVGAGLLLAQADGERQQAAIGNQTGGRVGFFLQTDDFAGDHTRFLAAGIRFHEEPRHEVYGIVAVFEDLYGNRWDLIQPA